MSGHAQFTIGSEVECTDWVCGSLRRVVVDPVAHKLTHLVVGPEHGDVAGGGRLVPIALAEPTRDGIHLDCTTSEFETLEVAEETHFVEGARGDWGYAQENLMSWPFYGMGMASVRTGSAGVIAGASPSPQPQTVTYDRVPSGEVQVRRGEPVHATDGDIGRVQGLIVDPADQAVTHVLLDEGHLWGKKRVAIPIGAVTGVDDDGVSLRLTKDDVRDLPPVDLDEQG